MSNESEKRWAIRLLARNLIDDPSPDVRILAARALFAIGKFDQRVKDVLRHASSRDPDVSVRIAIAQLLLDRYTPQSSPISEQPKINVQMTFNAPVYGVAGNIEGDQMVKSADELDQLLTDFTQFIADLQAKYPANTPEAAIPKIVDAEFQEIQITQPQRWQNLLNLKRLWQGAKKAGLKVGEHFTENNIWGKASLAFLEGLTEKSD
jgi:hypothetical protein